MTVSKELVTAPRELRGRDTKMTIQIGDTLQIKANTRLVYLGNQRAAVEMLMEKRFDKKTGARIVGEVETYWEKTQEVDLSDAKQDQWIALKAKQEG